MEMRWNVSRGFFTHTHTHTSPGTNVCTHRHSHKCICLAMLSQSGHSELSQISIRSCQCFRCSHCLQMKGWGEANEQNNILMIVYTVETWSNFGWLSGQCLPMTPLLVYRPEERRKKKDWLRTKQRQLNPSSFIHYINDILTRENSSLLLHYTVLDLCLVDW